MNDENQPPEERHPDEPQDDSVPTADDGEDAPPPLPSEEIEDPAEPGTEAPSG